MRQQRDYISDTVIFGGKIYSDFEYFNDDKKQKQHIEMYTPVKAIKGQSEQEGQRQKAYNDLFSTAERKNNYSKSTKSKIH